MCYNYLRIAPLPPLPAPCYPIPSKEVFTVAAVSSKVIEFPQREKKESSARRTRRKDGLYHVELRYKDASGVSKKKSFYGKSQKEANDKKKAFQRELEIGLKADDKTGFGAYADHWMATYKADLRPGTKATYQHDVDLMKAAFGEKKLKEIGVRAKTAAVDLSSLSTVTKNRVLCDAADLLIERTQDILKANAEDWKHAVEKQMPKGLLDRLTLTSERIEGMAEGLRTVAGLDDPIGSVSGLKRRPNDLMIGRMTVFPIRSL